MSQRHAFHLVDASPWPLTSSLGAFLLTSGGVMYLHSYVGGKLLFTLGFITILTCMAVWWRDVVRESTLEGHHTTQVQVGLRYGMILFIVSEIMFFFAFFWAFFHSSLSPTVELGAIWPPYGLQPFNAGEIPLLNTLILLLSGASVTWSHHSIIAGNLREASLGLGLTIVLAALFTALQGFEYVSAGFTISDGVYGSTFYMATGFHGIHVLIGTCFLLVCFFRLISHHFTRTHHFGFEAASWYWHFVDVVWLFLFVSVYWWGGA